MQCVSDLTKLRDAVIFRVRYLRGVYRRCQRPYADSDLHAMSFATIELDNLVIVGLRQFVKSSLLRGRTSGGHHVVSNVYPYFPEEAAALVYASLNPSGFRKKKSPSYIDEREEIVSRNPKDIEKVLLHYSSSNIVQFALALSLNSSAFNEIKIFRHFFAHRAKNTYENVCSLALNLGAPKPAQPEQLLISNHPNFGVPFFEVWGSDLETFFDLAV